MSNFYKLENIDNLLRCAICLDRFQTPKALECQHTFCLECLRGIYNTQTRKLLCPTCRKSIYLNNGLDGLPSNLLIISLMDVQPVKAKCPSCLKIETLTICEHCNAAKCTPCNEKHIDDVRLATKNKLEELQKINQVDLKGSIQDAFKNIRSEICNKFQLIRHQHDSILLNKQMDIIKQLEGHEKRILQHVENDLETVEQARLDIVSKNYHIESKNEPELINLLTTLSNIESNLTQKFVEHQAYLNSIEVSLQYDADQLSQINEFCNSMQLCVIDAKGNRHHENSTLLAPLVEEIDLTLRTFLNQEYKCRISLDKTIHELKEIFGKQENLDPNHITLTKTGNYFDQLDDQRTLRSYDCDKTTVLMICIRK